MGRSRAAREHYAITVNYTDSGGLLGLYGISSAAQPPVVEVISWCNEERENVGERWTAVLYCQHYHSPRLQQNNALLSLW